MRAGTACRPRVLADGAGGADGGRRRPIISHAVGRTVIYRDVDRETWVVAMIDSGVPPEYGDVLHALTETIASGHGAQSNDDVLVATGMKSTSFTEFAAKTAAAWR